MRMVIPKEQILPQLKLELLPKLADELRDKGITNFKFKDVKWEEEGIVIYYDDTTSGKSNKNKK